VVLLKWTVKETSHISGPPASLGNCKADKAECFSWPSRVDFLSIKSPIFRILDVEINFKLVHGHFHLWQELRNWEGTARGFACRACSFRHFSKWSITEHCRGRDTSLLFQFVDHDLFASLDNKIGKYTTCVE
jgi:hypothetical protein